MSLTDFRTLNIDIKHDDYVYPIAFKQNDTPTLYFAIYNDNVVADLTGYRCILKANKANGKGYEVRDGTIMGNIVKVECTSSFTQFAGEVITELCFLDSANNKQKTSFDITLLIKKQVLATNDSGDLPSCVITAAEKLDADLIEAEGIIQKAEIANRTLTSTVSNANIANINLNTSISTGNTLKNNLDISIATGNQTIEDLKKTNSEYTEHINNWDIHVTKAQKDKWDAYEAKIRELTSIIDNLLYKDSIVIDDEGNFIVDDEGNTIIV